MATQTKNSNTSRVGHAGQDGHGAAGAEPNFDQRSFELQQFGKQHYMPLGLPEQALQASIEQLNQILADSITIYNLYKKHHWQVTGPTFYQLHLLFDKHANEILETVDLLAERVMLLGGVAIADPHDVVEATKLERAPKGVEDVPAILARTVQAHQVIVNEVRQAIDITDENKDWGTNDLLMSDVLRLHEKQVWFISQHLVDTPFVNTAPDDTH